MQLDKMMLLLSIAVGTGDAVFVLRRFWSGETDAAIGEEFLGRNKGNVKGATEGVNILTCCRAAVSDVYLDIEDLGAHWDCFRFSRSHAESTA